MRRLEKSTFLELPLAVVEEGNDRFIFLTDKRNEVGFTVAVEVGDGNVDGAVAIVSFWTVKSGLFQSWVWFSR